MRSATLPILATITIMLAFGFSAPDSFGKNYKVRQADTSKSETDPDLVFLERLSRGISKISDRASKALVFVSTYKTVEHMPRGFIDPFEFFFGPGFRRPGQPDDNERDSRRGQNPRGDDRDQRKNGQNKKEKREGGVGSGFFIDVDKGYIVTNNHVVQGADSIELKLANGQTYPGKLIGRDKNTDIAVVQIKDTGFDKSGLSSLVFANSDNVATGDMVLALGAPFRLESSVSLGVVSAIDRSGIGIVNLENFIQTDAAINPGNSGGPLLNMRGQVIGINTAIYSRSGAYNGIGFAVAANIASRNAETLINQGYVKRGYLGIGLQPLSDDLKQGFGLDKDTRGGALVTEVTPGGPSEGKIEPGDVIVSINNKQVMSSTDVINSIGLERPETTVQITVIRSGKKKNIQVKLGEHPKDQDAERPESSGDEVANTKSSPFGVQVEKVTNTLKSEYKLNHKDGVVVVSVEPDSAADKSGLEEGDVVLKINNAEITSPKQFYDKLKKSKKALIYFERNGSRFFLSFKK